MKKKLFLIPCLLLFVFAIMLAPTSAKYVFEQSLTFNTIIKNPNGGRNLCDIYSNIDFTLSSGAASYGDLSAITDGNNNYTDSSWSNYETNWSKRKDETTAVLTFDWGVSTSLSEIFLYYYIDTTSTKVPLSVTFQYKDSNGNWNTITNLTETKNYEMSGVDVSTINGETWSTSYTGIAPGASFVIGDTITDAVALQITLNTRLKNGRFYYCVGLIEAEIYM